MWLRLRPLVFGLAASIAVFAALLAVAQIIFHSFPSDVSPRIGMEVYLVGAVLMLFLPSFAAGFFAKRYGALYGIVLAGIPIVLFNLVNEGVPSAFYLMWLAVAAVGGHCGQLVARRRNAP
jgi:hypothetical protein